MSKELKKYVMKPEDIDTDNVQDPRDHISELLDELMEQDKKKNHLGRVDE